MRGQCFTALAARMFDHIAFDNSNEHNPLHSCHLPRTPSHARKPLLTMAQTPDFEESRAPELTLPPLGDRTTDIRLLTLLPGRIGDHIRCTLHAVSLASKETRDSALSYIRCMLSTVFLASNRMRFSALSYTWGDPSGQRSIECNGCRAYIRRNLHSALSRLRDTQQVVILWTDALCINQLETDEALEEREVQVQLMHMIFSKAELVYVDLGEDVPEMDKILQLLQKFDSAQFRTLQEIKKFLDAGESYGLPSIEDPAWADTVRFMRRPWFTRVWIMQEFILAKHIQVVVGIRRLKFEFLQRLLLASIYYTSFIVKRVPNLKEEDHVLYFRLRSQLERGSENLSSLLKARAHRKENTDHQNFSSLLKRSRIFDATDKRDRAYALIHLADDVDHDKFPVRYKNETVNQTAQRVSRYLLVDSDGRHVDGGAALYCTIRLLGPGPSWTYDLDGVVHDDEQLLKDIDYWELSRIYQASARRDQLEASITGAILTVRGYVLGSIIQLSSALVCPEPGQGRLGKSLLDWILGVVDWATRIQRSSNTKLDVMSVWITSFAGYFYENTMDAVRYDHQKHPEISLQLSDFIEAVDELIQDYFGHQDKLEDVDSWYDYLLCKMDPVARAISATATHRRLAYTSDNLLALVPGSAEVGDVLSIFQGTPVPFVLRQAQGNYRLNGTAYIHNMMDGEVLRDPRYTVQNIDIC